MLLCPSHGVLLELGVRTGATAFTCTVKLRIVMHIKAVSLGLLSLLQYTRRGIDLLIKACPATRG